MKNNKLKPKINGFTLIETLVAVAILSAAVAGPLVMSIKNISSASISQDQLVAFYLGQEVIEYVKNIRDTNLINGSGNWLNGLSACKGESSGEEGSVGCYVDVKSDTVADCGANSCPKLQFDGQNYNYTTGDESVFTRTVKIDDTVGIGGDEAKISVFLKWTGKYGEKTMILQDNIFNWR